MGAATVLMASNMNLPSNVAGILADCPYSSPAEILKAVCRKMRIPVGIAYPFAVLGAMVYGHFCIWRSSAVKSVARTQIPVMLVHGDDDRLVPDAMSKRIFEACKSEKVLLSVKNAGHGLSYCVDAKAYEKAVQDFIDRVMV